VTNLPLTSFSSSSSSHHHHHHHYYYYYYYYYYYHQSLVSSIQPKESIPSNTPLIGD